MIVFAQRREEDDKNLPNHWLWEWVEVTACFPSQRSATFLSWNARVPSPALPLGQRSGMVSNPEWASSASWCCGEDRLLSCKLRWRDSFDFFQLQRKGWAQWQQVIITFRRSCDKSDKSQRPSKKEGTFLPFLLLEEKSVVRSCLRKWLPFWSLLFLFLELQLLATCGWSKVDIGGMRGQGTASRRMQANLHWCGPQAPVQGGRPPLEETGEPCRLPLKSSSVHSMRSEGPMDKSAESPIFRAYWSFSLEISRIRDLLFKKDHRKFL